MSPALFLDRDGVVVEEIKGAAATHPSELSLKEGVISLILNARAQGYHLIIVSNQPDYGLGKISEVMLSALETRFVELMKEASVLPDKILYCYHHPNAQILSLKLSCACKKPKPGLLFTAQKEFSIDMATSYIIGDRASDIRAGRDAGVRTILLDPQATQLPYLQEHRVLPDFTIRSLAEAIDIIRIE